MVVLATSLIPVAPAAAVSNRAIDGEYPLVVAPGGQVQHDIDWPYVVYKDGRFDWLEINNGQPHVRVYNMETGRDFPVTPENRGLWEQSNPSVYGKKVVYSDDRHTDGNGDCNVYMYDIATGLESVVASETYGQGNPYIYGDVVAWVDWRNGSHRWQNSDIYMKNLRTGVESAVCTATGDQREPTVWENYIVWRDTRSGWSSVYLYDMVSGEETCVAQGGAPNNYYYDPFVGDGKIAYHKQWYDGSSWRQEIHLYDIESAESTTVSSVTTGSRWHPVVRDGWVVWPDRRDGSETEVWGYNYAANGMAADAHTDQVLVEAEDDGSWFKYAGRATYGDGVLLWHDHRPGDGDDDVADMYAKFLTGEPAPTQKMPLQGEDRYKTAVDVSKQAFPHGSEVAVIATGENWPDALAGASLAGSYGAPILLVGDWTIDGMATKLPAAVAAELERLGVWTVYILGGERAVSTGVETQIADLLENMDRDMFDGSEPEGEVEVIRLAGADRYETACLVASETVDAWGDEWDGTAFVTTGRNWPDALAASPLSAWAGYPVFLSDTDGLRDSTQQCMEDLGVDGAVVLGGTVAVPLSVLGQVKAAGVTEIERVGGANRYATAALISEFGVGMMGMDFGVVGISTGEKFPDALSTGAALGLSGNPMLLTPGTWLHPATKDSVQSHKYDISQVRFAGGPNAVTETVRSQIMALLY